MCHSPFPHVLNTKDVTWRCGSPELVLKYLCWAGLSDERKVTSYVTHCFCCWVLRKPMQFQFQGVIDGSFYFMTLTWPTLVWTHWQASGQSAPNLNVKAPNGSTHWTKSKLENIDIYKHMNDIADAVSIFFDSLQLILFISLVDLLPALSSAAGVRFSRPRKFAPLITNWAVPYSTELSCTCVLPWPKSWLHTSLEVLKKWWEDKFIEPNDPLRNKNLTMSDVQSYGRYSHVHLKMQRLSHFPRLLQFQKRLGFNILHVNSCSNLAFTEQEQCQGWPSEPRWQQVAPTKKPAGKTSKTILES